MSTLYCIDDNLVVAPSVSASGTAYQVNGVDVELEMDTLTIKVPRELKERMDERLGRIRQTTLLGTLYLEAARRLDVDVPPAWEDHVVKQEQVSQEPVEMDTPSEYIRAKRADKTYLVRQVYNDLRDLPSSDDERGWDSSGLAHYVEPPKDRAWSAREQALEDAKERTALAIMHLRSSRKYASIYAHKRPTKAQALAEVSLLLSTMPKLFSEALHGWVDLDTLLGVLDEYHRICEMELEALRHLSLEPLQRGWRDQYISTYIEDRRAYLAYLHQRVRKQELESRFKARGTERYPEWAGDMINEVRSGLAAKYLVKSHGLHRISNVMRRKATVRSRARIIFNARKELEDKVEIESLKYRVDHLIALDLAFTPLADIPTMKKDLDELIESDRKPVVETLRQYDAPIPLPAPEPEAFLPEADHEVLDAAEMERRVLKMWGYLKGLPANLRKSAYGRGFGV